MNRCLSVIAVASSLVIVGPPADAQSPSVADSLIQRGAVQQGESLLYAAVRAHPRDPASRLALGRYLTARGAVRVGVTLVEEAVQFGLDRWTAAPVLAPMYAALEEYPELLSLPPSTISPAERERARWLVAHPSRTVAPDSLILMAYASRSTMPNAPLGTITVRVNGRPAVMALRTSGYGISVSDALAASAKVHRFPENAAHSIIGAVDSIGLGRVAMTNFPVTVESAPAGLDGSVSLTFLARFSPTFDPATNRIMLRVGNTQPENAVGNRFALMDSGSDLEIAQAGGWAPLRLPQVATMLKQRRWTLDLKHGQIVVE